MSQLRRDPLGRGWVIISPERGLQPSDFGSVARPQASISCSYCEGREGETSSEVLAIRRPDSKVNGPGWQVRVIPTEQAVLEVGSAVINREGVYFAVAGVGVHEVIVETTGHDLDMDRYPLEHLVQILAVYKQRLRDLTERQGLRFTQVFRNHGAIAGAASEHPHSQLIATPVETRWLQEELEACREYQLTEKRSLFGDLIEQELAGGERVVTGNDRFIAIAPFASRSPFEVWILPREENPYYTQARDSDLLDLASILQKVLWAIKNALEDPPYNFVLHTAPWPPGVEGSPPFHWHIEIIPRLTRYAGFEWGIGFYVNPTPPEEAARFLREVLALKGTLA